MNYPIFKDDLEYFVQHRLKEYRMWTDKTGNVWKHLAHPNLRHSFFMVLDYGSRRLCRIPFGELEVYHSPQKDQNRFQEYEKIENVKLGKKSDPTLFMN